MSNLAVNELPMDHAAMWIFTQYGFFSAVCARKGDGSHGQPVDPDRIMVRARRREHLDRLLARFSDLLGSVQVHESRSTDYRFRVFVDKADWADVLQDLGDELDYDNFKSAVANRLTSDTDGDYENALHDVWEVMYGLQRSE